MKKSSHSELKNRGFVTNDEVTQHSHLSHTEILIFLDSKSPEQRTIAAKLIYKNRNALFADSLTNALSTEKKLYTKIAISEALGNLGAIGVEKCIPYLGKIGSNQYKSLPNKPFDKNNYPLPRDIIARTICKAGDVAIPILLEKLDIKNIQQLSEGIDAIGYISYYQKNILAKDYVLKLIAQYETNNLILWKLIRALQSFPSTDVIHRLQLIAQQTKVKQLKREAERSLVQIFKLSLRGEDEVFDEAIS